jgi:hypothetical protein
VSEIAGRIAGKGIAAQEKGFSGYEREGIPFGGKIEL